MAIMFEVFGRPQGKQRARESGNSKRMYTPQKTRDYEELIAWEYKKKANGFKFEGAVSVIVCSYFTPPKSLSEKKRKELDGKPYEHKPDGDNIMKVVCDGLNGVAWKDDKSVTQQRSIKRYNIRKESIMVIIDNDT